MYIRTPISASGASPQTTGPTRRNHRLELLSGFKRAGGRAVIHVECLPAALLFYLLQATTGLSEETAAGSCATMRVPLLVECISKVPPNCRSLSRIPRIPTPGMPIDDVSSCLCGGMPLP